MNLETLYFGSLWHIGVQSIREMLLLKQYFGLLLLSKWTDMTVREKILSASSASAFLGYMSFSPMDGGIHVQDHLVAYVYDE